MTFAQDGQSEAEQHYSAALRQFIDEAPLERRAIVEFVATAAASLPAGSRIADVGAGSAPFREFFGHVDYLTVDRAQSLHGDASDFDVVASADSIPLESESLDAILCTQVLEHLSNPAEALAEFHRLLKPSARLFLTAPLVWEEHERPYDFYRYTRSGLEHLLGQAGFERLEIAARGNYFETLSQLLSNARWTLGESTGESGPARIKAFTRLDKLAQELLEMAPLDARESFPLGYQVTASRPAQSTTSGTARSRPPLNPPVDTERLSVLYLAPWVDLGGSDKGTIDWFKHIDRDRWAPSIITTQPSANRWLPEIEPYADEIWSLPDLMAGSDFPSFVLGFIETRKVKIIHIMNSRLAFDLMPDMTCLPDPPVVVVQHHAEEHDRSGYVRYVASRYGNLVDAYSVTSEQLAEAMLDYDIARSRIHVIPTGVDGLTEFNPSQVAPFEDLEDEGPRILWPGRLVDQKDPLLTLEVVRRLQDRGLTFTLHVVGDGDLKEDVLRRTQELGIGHLIRWHEPSHQMPRWYRSCDLLLMTSTFEGVPYVIYESLAMGVPVVAPALPGNVELMGEDGGTLIDPRDDVNAYADAIESLLRDEAHRAAIGVAARERMLQEFSLPVMGQRHDALYEHLLSHRRVRDLQSTRETICEETAVPSAPPRVVFPRDSLPERSVAVIVPCYQHGRFLPAAIQSLHDQTLLPSRIIVVDDASADPETTLALDLLDRDPRITIIRLPVNSGPSIARNRALAEINENYVLPLDADDILLPRALETMVDQLELASESVGFIYPNVQHFGNRHDYYEAPEYNLDALLNDNYCAATTLFDRRIFDAGIRYAEDIVFGHEDWDLILQMAERHIYGEAAEGPTFMYRKRGFSRVNAVEYGPESFHKRIEQRHPILYRQRRDAIKAEWAPALSLVLVGGCDGSAEPWPSNLLASLAAQTCGDFELVGGGLEVEAMEGLQVSHVGGTALECIETAVHKARGRFVLLAGTLAADGLIRRTFIEQVIRSFWNDVSLSHFALGTVADRRGPRLAALSPVEAAEAIPCGIAWRRSPLNDSYEVPLGHAETPLEDFILRWQQDGPLGWRSA